MSNTTVTTNRQSSSDSASLLLSLDEVRNRPSCDDCSYHLICSLFRSTWDSPVFDEVCVAKSLVFVVVFCVLLFAWLSFFQTWRCKFIFDLWVCWFFCTFRLPFCSHINNMTCKYIELNIFRKHWRTTQWNLPCLSKCSILVWSIYCLWDVRTHISNGRTISSTMSDEFFRYCLRVSRSQ